MKSQFGCRWWGKGGQRGKNTLAVYGHTHTKATVEVRWVSGSEFHPTGGGDRKAGFLDIQLTHNRPSVGGGFHFHRLPSCCSLPKAIQGQKCFCRLKRRSWISPSPHCLRPPSRLPYYNNSRPQTLCQPSRTQANPKLK